MEHDKPVDNRAERNKTGYGAIRVVIFSVYPADFITPSNQDFYYFSTPDLLLKGYCISLCLCRATEILHLHEVANLDQLLCTSESPVEIDGTFVTSICEGMHMHQELLDTCVCDNCGDLLREKCADY